MLGNLDSNNICNAVDITIDSIEDNKNFKIPVDYDVDNVSQKIVKIIQGYTPKINSETWKKSI